MNGFGFIEYKDAMDARDVVPGKYMPVCSEGLLANEASLFSHSSFPYVEDPRRIPLMSATTPPDPRLITISKMDPTSWASA